MTPAPDIPEEDRRFAELAVSQGVCTSEQVAECVALLRRLREAGASPLPRLGALLAKKGWLVPRDAPSAPEIFDESIPREVAEAAADPANRVGGYVRVARLGSGGMGEVWRAWDRKLRRWVALKSVKQTEPGDLARFRREALVAASINHPNIAAVYQVEESEGHAHIVMQLVDGQTVASLPRGDHGFLARIVRDAALAVHHAHEMGIIHRDLKPQNLMVEETTRSPRVFVMDFGVAKQTRLKSSLSLSGTVVGTPTYMSPEQARGRQGEVGPASDVYALGATLYDLLTGQPPFLDREVLEVLRRVVEEEPVPVRRRNAKVHRDLETIVMKCIEKEPLHRYPSAQALAEDLDRWQKGEAIAAHPASLFYRMGKKLSKHKALAALAGALVMILGVGTYWTLAIRQARRWVRDAQAMARDGKYGDAKTLLDRARGRIAVDEPLYRLCESKVEEDRRRAELKRREEEVFRPIEEQLLVIPANLQGRRRALILVEEGLAKYPQSADWWTVKGNFHLSLGEFPEALAANRRAMEIDPTSAILPFTCGTILLEHLGDLEGAHREFARVVEMEPDGMLGSLARVLIASMKGDFGEVIRISDWAVAQGMRHERFHFVRGLAWGDRSSAHYDIDEAIREHTKALELDALQERTYRERGKLYTDLGDFDAAISDFDKAVELSPQDPFAYDQRGYVHSLRGEALQRSGRLKEAKDEYEKALADANRAVEMIPGQGVAYFHRGYAHAGRAELAMRLGRDAEREVEIDAAVQDLTRALELNPSLVPAYLHRGIAHLVRERWDDAIRDFDQAVARNADYGDAYAGRAHARIAKGNLEGGIQDFETALRVSPADWVNRRAVEAELRSARARQKR